MKEFKIIDGEPLVSIVVPAYNAQKFIAATLDSLNKQILRDIEIIVVNDGSTDNTENVVKHFFFDRRLKYFKKDNGGTGSAVNLGMEKARGRYLTWCSADNVYLPNFASELSMALRQCEMQKAPVSFVYSDFLYIDAKGQPIKKVIHQNPQPRHDLVNGYDLGISFMFTRDLWNKTGPYWNKICEDYEWATRAAQYTEFGLVRNILAAFRVHDRQITGSRKEEEAAAAEYCKTNAKTLLRMGKYGALNVSV